MVTKDICHYLKCIIIAIFSMLHFSNALHCTYINVTIGDCIATEVRSTPDAIGTWCKIMEFDPRTTHDFDLYVMPKDGTPQERYVSVGNIQVECPPHVWSKVSFRGDRSHSGEQQWYIFVNGESQVDVSGDGTRKPPSVSYYTQYDFFYSPYGHCSSSTNAPKDLNHPQNDPNNLPDTRNFDTSFTPQGRSALPVVDDKDLSEVDASMNLGEFVMFVFAPFAALICLTLVVLCLLVCGIRRRIEHQRFGCEYSKRGTGNYDNFSSVCSYPPAVLMAAGDRGKRANTDDKPMGERLYSNQRKSNSNSSLDQI